jgi:3-oxoacyl-[acyl-carrier protein] reductase
LSEIGRGKNYHILINYTSNQAAAEETLQGVEELGYQEKFLNLM